MTDVRGAVGERRDELVVFVREPVWHPGEHPELLGDATAREHAVAGDRCGVA